LLQKDLIRIRDLSREDILDVLDQAEAFHNILDRDIKKVPTLRGKVIVNLFFEPSTRTRTSFELAGKILSADVVNISKATSSAVKGESLKDTALTIKSLGADFIIVRHSHAGVPELLSRCGPFKVINAGDGAGEHPTQALLDLFTMRRKTGRLEGLNVTIMGDISHSRVARSNIYALTKLGANVNLVAPPTLLPAEIDKLGVNVFHRFEDVLDKTDVLYLLRIQLERQNDSLFPSLREYAKLYGINAKKLAMFDRKVLVMHPGPINRGVEIGADVADNVVSLIEEQVRNGVVVRMAILFLMARKGV
jgi:aspartate carbamoyltransferase catalytic subunit